MALPRCAIGNADGGSNGGTAAGGRGFSHPKKDKIPQSIEQWRILVRVAGVEPTASWTRTKRATNCATPGKLFYYMG